MQDERITKNEEAIAHLTQMVEDLSAIVARQDAEVDRLTRRVEMLMQREAQREVDESGALPLADQKPPHW